MLEIISLKLAVWFYKRHANRHYSQSGVICGKNTHNQHIEALWRDVCNGGTGLFHEIVSYMEDEEILDPFNEFDLTALHHVCLLLMATVMA